MAMKIRLLLAEFDGGGEVLCLCDHEGEKVGLPDYGEARAVVVLFSQASLKNVLQLESVIGVMQIAEAHSRNGTQFAIIPVHLPGLAFPTQQYFQDDFAVLWGGRPGLEKAKEMLQRCFKTISVPLEISGSDTVLSAQVGSIFHRIPASEARQNLGGAGSSAAMATVRVPRAGRVGPASHPASRAPRPALVPQPVGQHQFRTMKMSFYLQTRHLCSK